MIKGVILVFWVFAGLTVLFAFLVTFSRSLVRGVLALFFFLLSTAGMYFSLGADFIGAAQVVLYVGGVVFLVLFGVLLTKNAGKVKPYFTPLQSIPAGIFSAGIVYLLWKVADKMPVKRFPPLHKPLTPILGELFMKKFVIAFEVASILLVGVLIGAVYLVRREVK